MTAPTEPGYVREGRATEMGVAGGMCVCEGSFCMCVCVCLCACVCVKAGWCGHKKLSGVGGRVFLSLGGVGEEDLGVHRETCVCQ